MSDNPDTAISKFYSSMASLAELIDKVRPGLIVPKDTPTAHFRARVQDLGRIVIPEFERQDLRIEKGDVVEVFIWKSKAGGKTSGPA